VRHSKPYSVLFILAITIVFGFLLALAATALKPAQDFNAAVNVKRNILVAVGLLERGADVALEEIDRIYNESMQSFAVDPQGRIVDGVRGADLDLEDELDKPGDQQRYPVFVVATDGQAEAYALPVYGKGLWSTLYGYLALEPDLNTVRGITFYDHGETPGLGAEITEPWFQENFVGKQIFDDLGNLRAITVVKGKVVDRVSRAEERRFYVDGISGASITSRGVTNLLADKLGIYEPYIRRVRGQQAAL